MKNYRVSYPSDTCRQWQVSASSAVEAAEKQAVRNGLGELVKAFPHGSNIIAHFAPGNTKRTSPTVIIVYGVFAHGSAAL